VERMNRFAFLRMPHETDYREYYTYLQNRAKLITDNEELTPHLKGIHKKVYYLNAFIQELELDQSSQQYLSEVIIDLILLMDLFSQNYIKSVRMHLRSSIEEFNRFLLTINGVDFSELSISRINDRILEVYKHNHPIHSKVSALCSDYADLCTFVHVSADSSFTNKLVLSDFHKVNEKEVEKIARQVFRNIQNILYILICEYREKFHNMTKHMQNYLLQQLSQKDQQEINSILES